VRPLPEQAVHLPFEAGAYRMAMGLVSVPEAAWFEFDDRYLPELAEKRRLLATARDEVFAATPESGAARAEARDLIIAALTAHHPEWFSRDGATVRNHLTDESWRLSSIDPLASCGRLVQEDICLVQDSPVGPILSAAVLCFPSRWRLSDKIGKPLRQVHGPVPLYADRLAGAVDRFMRNLKPDHIASRFAWSLLDDPALFQPDGRSRTDGRTITDEDAGERVFLRVERQTLRRLPVSAAIVFGIRVHVYPLSRVIDTAERAATLAAAVEALPAEMQPYKNLSPFSSALGSWLGKQARS
jgi:hypothetical protein